MTFQPSLLNDYRISNRTRVILDLAAFREEWEKAVEGGSLLKVEAPVGLLLADIADKLELTSQERYAFLGGRLIDEVDCVREQHVSRRLPL
jgi:hypothetical protein